VNGEPPAKILSIRVMIFHCFGEDQERPLQPHLFIYISIVYLEMYPPIR
jgi:hypothetical protein